MPFWSSFGLAEYEISGKKEERDFIKPYDGKLGEPPTKSKKWFVFNRNDIKPTSNII